MTAVELGFGILVGIIILILVVSVVTIIITKANSKEINNIQNVYFGKLANSNSSIQGAMKYLKLTNGLKQTLNGEKK